jgi:hypothetical protein
VKYLCAFFILASLAIAAPASARCHNPLCRCVNCQCGPNCSCGARPARGNRSIVVRRAVLHRNWHPGFLRGPGPLARATFRPSPWF